VVLGDLHMSVNAEKMFTQHNCLAEGEWRGEGAGRGGAQCPAWGFCRTNVLRKNKNIYTKKEQVLWNRFYRTGL